MPKLAQTSDQTLWSGNAEGIMEEYQFLIGIRIIASQVRRREWSGCLSSLHGCYELNTEDTAARKTQKYNYLYHLNMSHPFNPNRIKRLYQVKQPWTCEKSSLVKFVRLLVDVTREALTHSPKIWIVCNSHTWLLLCLPSLYHPLFLPFPT